MTVELATWLVRAAYLYVAIGVGLLPWSHGRGLRRVDLTAADGPWGFRVLISPGLVALWPWLVARGRRSEGHPRPEKNAHRARASARDQTS